MTACPPYCKIAFFGAGWQIHVESLAAYLAGREGGDVEARWKGLVPPYQALAAKVARSMAASADAYPTLKYRKPFSHMS